MDNQELHSKLSVDQRATIAKVLMATYGAFDQCNNEHDVNLFFHYLMSKLQQQAINRLLTVTNSYVEVVSEEEKPVDAVQTP